jgi:nicotinamide riboside transporter PnuC
MNEKNLKVLICSIISIIAIVVIAWRVNVPLAVLLGTIFFSMIALYYALTKDKDEEVKKMNKKSQAFLEFLTVYGWAFLVILVMIGALAYFEILSPSYKYNPDKDICDGTCGQILNDMWVSNSASDMIPYLNEYIDNDCRNKVVETCVLWHRE